MMVVWPIARSYRQMVAERRFTVQNQALSSFQEMLCGYYHKIHKIVWRLVAGFGSFCASMRKAGGMCQAFVRHQAPEVLTSVSKLPGFRKADGVAMSVYVMAHF